MFKALKSFFAMLETLFGAGEKAAKAVDHLAAWGEQTAAAFKDEATVEREKKMRALQASLNATPAP